jgi:hypothetical protein
MNMDSLNLDKTPDIVRDIETALNVPDGFFLSLVTENDWSFIIKMHALMESALTFLLSQTLTISVKDFSEETFDEKALSRLLAWMELSGKRVGKVALAESLGLVLDYQRVFLNRLSELRNEVIHSVENVSFDFPTYVGSLDPNQKRNFIDAFGFAVGSTDAIKAIMNTDLSREDFVIRRTKFAIWLSALACLSEIAYCVRTFKTEQRIATFEQQMAKMFENLLKTLAPVSDKLYPKQN